MANMHVIYGLAGCNAADARRVYREHFLNRRLINEDTFEQIHERLWKTGTLKKLHSVLLDLLCPNCLSFFCSF